MPYKFHFKPNNASALTLNDYAARFIDAGLTPRSMQDPTVRRFILSKQGTLYVTHTPAKEELHAVVQINLTDLRPEAERVRHRLETWLRLAAQTDSMIHDGYTMDLLVDEQSIAACVERIIAKRMDCFKGGQTWVMKDFRIRP